MSKYPALKIERKSGTEQFHVRDQKLPMDLLGFWQWSASDLTNNALRGVLAEYIIASAVGCNEGTRTEWDAYDIRTNDGVKIEVKSSAYIQSWQQEKLSPIKFNVAPTLGWDAESNTSSVKAMRQSDVYVFCVLANKDQETITPLDLSQWAFYIISTEKLNKSIRNQKTITLSSLLKLAPDKAEYEEILTVIRRSMGV